MTQKKLILVHFHGVPTFFCTQINRLRTLLNKYLLFKFPKMKTSSNTKNDPNKRPLKIDTIIKHNCTSNGFSKFILLGLAAASNMGNGIKILPSLLNIKYLQIRP
ncbi:hypothetical protein V6Z12_A08G145200 [Gossypium hirsutum]